MKRSKYTRTLAEMKVRTETTLPGLLLLRVPERLRSTFEGLGRTEDLKFSPSGSHLALLAYSEEKIVLLGLTRKADEVEVMSITSISSPQLQFPHGIEFLSESVVAVANRLGGVLVFRLPELEEEVSDLVLEPLYSFQNDDRGHFHSPGSLALSKTSEDSYEVLVCNNYRHTITRHYLTRDFRLEARPYELLLQKLLNVPDGIAVSADGDWIAVSNHETHHVFVYRNDESLAPDSEPDAVLRLVKHPHGLRFGEDSFSLFVADAESPNVFVFQAEGCWQGVYTPERYLRVMSDETFQEGNTGRGEGGPKGIALSPDTGLLAVTSEHQLLACFELRTLDREDALFESHPERRKLELSHELRVAESHGLYRKSLSWRLTRPLRSLYTRLWVFRKQLEDKFFKNSR